MIRTNVSKSIWVTSFRLSVTQGYASPSHFSQSEFAIRLVLRTLWLDLRGFCSQAAPAECGSIRSYFTVPADVQSFELWCLLVPPDRLLQPPVSPCFVRGAVRSRPGAPQASQCGSCRRPLARAVFLPNSPRAITRNYQ